MAKKLSMVSVVLSLVVVLALVYFFRPQTFSFLKQGFADEDFADEDYADETEGFADEDYADEDFEEDFTQGAQVAAAKKNN